jgi:hypothetical protein
MLLALMKICGPFINVGKTIIVSTVYETGRLQHLVDGVSHFAVVQWGDANRTRAILGSSGSSASFGNNFNCVLSLCSLKASLVFCQRA